MLIGISYFVIKSKYVVFIFLIFVIESEYVVSKMLIGISYFVIKSKYVVYKKIE